MLFYHNNVFAFILRSAFSTSGQCAHPDSLFRHRETDCSLCSREPNPFIHSAVKKKKSLCIWPLTQLVFPGTGTFSCLIAAIIVLHYILYQFVFLAFNSLPIIIMAPLVENNILVYLFIGLFDHLIQTNCRDRLFGSAQIYSDMSHPDWLADSSPLSQ